MLAVVLGSMTSMTLQKAFEQRQQEQDGTNVHDEGNVQGSQEDNSLLGTFFGPSEEEKEKEKLLKETQASKRINSYIMLVALLAICVVCGVLRHHMGVCIHGLKTGIQEVADEKCSHPVLQVFFRNHMEKWLQSKGTAVGCMTSILALPIMTCMCISIYFSYDLKTQGWPVQKLVMYQTVAFITGMLSALIGIGGGLIFSPFMLVTGVEPAVAVATSSTCVIFSAASTALQDLLIDRVHMALALFYGSVNIASSAFGTKLVHYLQTQFSKQRSIITFIVAGAVGVSMIMAVYKAAREFKMPHFADSQTS